MRQHLDLISIDYELHVALPGRAPSDMYRVNRSPALEVTPSCGSCTGVPPNQTSHFDIECAYNINHDQQQHQKTIHVREHHRARCSKKNTHVRTRTCACISLHFTRVARNGCALCWARVCVHPAGISTSTRTSESNNIIAIANQI